MALYFLRNGDSSSSLVSLLIIAIILTLLIVDLLLIYSRKHLWLIFTRWLLISRVNAPKLYTCVTQGFGVIVIERILIIDIFKWLIAEPLNSSLRWSLIRKTFVGWLYRKIQIVLSNASDFAAVEIARVSLLQLHTCICVVTLTLAFASSDLFLLFTRASHGRLRPRPCES